ncbi:MAG: hypothetical protein M3540_07755 [Actinomycetota bacterium]|nr:hypothetical protein [Actinomycetota bacterium]
MLFAALVVGSPASAVEERQLHAVVSVSNSGGGRVVSSPPGIDCGSDCSESFPSIDNVDTYSPIDLTATAAPGYEFSGWGGACSGTGGCTIDPLLPNEGQSVTATFTLIPQPNYQVSVGRIGSGSVASSPAGISCPGSCSASFDTGSSVSLSATPAAGWSFGGWGGDCGGGGGCNLTINSPKSVTAIFNPPPPATHTLVVSKAGDGNVSSNPSGIDCGTTCSAAFADGGQVTLTANGVGGASFNGWGGDCSGTNPTCTVSLNADRTVTASFGQAPPPPLPMAVSRTGNGTVTSTPAAVNCGAVCTANFPPSSSVVLTAAAAAGWRFSGWGGACAGAEPTCTLAMNVPKTVTASFAELPASFPLALSVQGSGSVVSTPAGIDCGEVCSASFAVGGTVALQATPAPGWTFSGWSGGCAGRARTCTLTVDDPKAVAASFARRTDQAAPRVTALASTGKRGNAARLRYRVSDNSGKSREHVTVYRGGKRLATIRSPLDAAEAAALFYYVRWKVPRSLTPGKLRFCVQAWDAAGNRSKTSCASLRIT